MAFSELGTLLADVCRDEDSLPFSVGRMAALKDQ